MRLRRKEMRNWCAALAMGALLALPLCAQQRNSGADGDTANAAEKDADSSKAQRLFALPATPRPTPFPGAAAAADTRPPGTLVPRYEFSAMYDYINFAPGDPFANFNSHGGGGSFYSNPSQWVGAHRRLCGLLLSPYVSPPSRSTTAR